MTEVKSSGGSTAHDFALLFSIVYGAAVGGPSMWRLHAKISAVYAKYTDKI